MENFTEEQTEEIVDISQEIIDRFGDGVYSKNDVINAVNYVYEKRGLVPEEFEHQGWYKHKAGGVGYFETEDSGYGTLAYGTWYVGKHNGELKEFWGTASEAEIEEVLIVRAKELGFKEGVKYNNSNIGYENSKTRTPATFGKEFEWMKCGNKDYYALYFYGVAIFREGKWAEIIEEKKGLFEEGHWYRINGNELGAVCFHAGGCYGVNSLGEWKDDVRMTNHREWEKITAKKEIREAFIREWRIRLNGERSKVYVRVGEGCVGIKLGLQDFRYLPEIDVFIVNDVQVYRGGKWAEMSNGNEEREESRLERIPTMNGGNGRITDKINEIIDHINKN